jgi:hypothetical protein
MAYGQYDPYNVYSGDMGYEPGLTSADLGGGDFSQDSYLKNSYDPFQSQWPDIKPSAPSPMFYETPGGGLSNSPYLKSETPSSIGGGGAGSPSSTPKTGVSSPGGGSLGSAPFTIGGPKTVSTQSKILPPDLTPPVYPTTIPTYTPPAYDTKRVQALTELAAAPGMRNLRTQMREAQGKYYENPNVKRMTLRDAMAGYGLGMENVMGGARSQATQQYQAEYAPEVTAAQTNYQAEINRMNAQYQAALMNYMNRVNQQTITQTMR